MVAHLETTAEPRLKEAASDSIPDSDARDFRPDRDHFARTVRKRNATGNAASGFVTQMNEVAVIQ